MTAKEKAKELIDNFSEIVDASEGVFISYVMAKQCALIAVNEIIESNPESPNNHNPFTGRIQGIRQNFIDAENYWQEVKKEIELL